MIKIDKDIPFPVRREGSGYPWHELQVGESFEHDGGYDNARQSAFYHSRTTGKTFKARTLNNKVRVWRIK